MVVLKFRHHFSSSAQSENLFRDMEYLKGQGHRSHGR